MNRTPPHTQGLVSRAHFQSSFLFWPVGGLVPGGFRASTTRQRTVKQPGAKEGRWNTRRCYIGIPTKSCSDHDRSLAKLTTIPEPLPYLLDMLFISKHNYLIEPP